jgi:very-short-patch-repair endonuclease
MTRIVALGAVGEFAASHHGAFTRSQAAAFEVHRGVIARLKQRGVLTEPIPNVLVIVGAPATWQQQLYVATLAGATPGIAAGPSAARLHRIDGFESDPRVHVATTRGSHLSRPGVTVSQTISSYGRRDIVEVQQIRCSGLARTVCDIFGQFGPAVGERAIDDFQRRGESMAWLEHTARGVQDVKGRGLARMIADIAARRNSGEVRGSWFEKLVEQCLCSPRIPGVERQHTIRDSGGRFVARVDLAVPIVRLGIEAHSRRFHTGPHQEAIDQRRDNAVALQGWELTYIGYDDAKRTPRQVCQYVERLVQRRALDLGIDLPKAS